MRISFVSLLICPVSPLKEKWLKTLKMVKDRVSVSAVCFTCLLSTWQYMCFLLLLFLLLQLDEEQPSLSVAQELTRLLTQPVVSLDQS